MLWLLSSLFAAEAVAVRAAAQVASPIEGQVSSVLPTSAMLPLMFCEYLTVKGRAAALAPAGTIAMDRTASSTTRARQGTEIAIGHPSASRPRELSPDESGIFAPQ